MNPITTKQEGTNFWKLLSKILFLLAVCSVVTAVTLEMEIDYIQSFSKKLSIIISIILFVLWLVVYLLFDKKAIPKAMWTTALILSLLCIIGVKSLCSFSIPKWEAHPKLRPLMGQSLCYASTRYNLSVDDVSKETHPDFLGLYSRRELEAMFGSSKNEDAKNHVTINLGDFKETTDYDIYFAYTDYDGTDYWIVAYYCSRKNTNKFTALQSFNIVPEGTVIDYSKAED